MNKMINQAHTLDPLTPIEVYLPLPILNNSHSSGCLQGRDESRPYSSVKLHEAPLNCHSSLRSASLCDGVSSARRGCFAALSMTASRDFMKPGKVPQALDFSPGRT